MFVRVLIGWQLPASQMLLLRAVFVFLTDGAAGGRRGRRAAGGAARPRASAQARRRRPGTDRCDRPGRRAGRSGTGRGSRPGAARAPAQIAIATTKPAR